MALDESDDDFGSAAEPRKRRRIQREGSFDDAVSNAPKVKKFTTTPDVPKFGAVAQLQHVMQVKRARMKTLSGRFEKLVRALLLHTDAALTEEINALEQGETTKNVEAAVVELEREQERKLEFARRRYEMQKMELHRRHKGENRFAWGDFLNKRSQLRKAMMEHLTRKISRLRIERKAADLEVELDLRRDTFRNKLLEQDDHRKLSSAFFGARDEPLGATAKEAEEDLEAMNEGWERSPTPMSMDSEGNIDELEEEYDELEALLGIFRRAAWEKGEEYCHGLDLLLAGMKADEQLQRQLSAAPALPQVPHIPPGGFLIAHPPGRPPTLPPGARIQYVISGPPPPGQVIMNAYPGSAQQYAPPTPKYPPLPDYSNRFPPNQSANTVPTNAFFPSGSPYPQGFPSTPPQNVRPSYSPMPFPTTTPDRDIQNSALAQLSEFASKIPPRPTNPFEALAQVADVAAKTSVVAAPEMDPKSWAEGLFAAMGTQSAQKTATPNQPRPTYTVRITPAGSTPGRPTPPPARFDAPRAPPPVMTLGSSPAAQPAPEVAPPVSPSPTPIPPALADRRESLESRRTEDRRMSEALSIGEAPVVAPITSPPVFPPAIQPSAFSGWTRPKSATPTERTGIPPPTSNDGSRSTSQRVSPEKAPESPAVEFAQVVRSPARSDDLDHHDFQAIEAFDEKMEDADPAPEPVEDFDQPMEEAAEPAESPKGPAMGEFTTAMTAQPQNLATADADAQINQFFDIPRTPSEQQHVTEGIGEKEQEAEEGETARVGSPAGSDRTIVEDSPEPQPEQEPEPELLEQEDEHRDDVLAHRISRERASWLARRNRQPFYLPPPESDSEDDEPLPPTALLITTSSGWQIPAAARLGAGSHPMAWMSNMPSGTVPPPPPHLQQRPVTMPRGIMPRNMLGGINWPVSNQAQIDAQLNAAFAPQSAQPPPPPAPPVEESGRDGPGSPAAIRAPEPPQPPRGMKPGERPVTLPSSNATAIPTFGQRAQPALANALRPPAFLNVTPAAAMLMQAEAVPTPTKLPVSGSGSGAEGGASGTGGFGGDNDGLMDDLALMAMVAGVAAGSSDPLEPSEGDGDGDIGDLMNLDGYRKHGER
ncbi:hypothetical protein SAICODRAFT_25780 [Saitoella complicata NRRL Y-17804]|nr:uncharacterized protein SAICODRAFT_25780 [Saitoella complicata NRRL Y-17804]ODQ52462.1 hypothetical protein SAICODRAFT_25780 [Saitoella complicata NRRL Y-17804]